MKTRTLSILAVIGIIFLFPHIALSTPVYNLISLGNRTTTIVAINGSGQAIGKTVFSPGTSATPYFYNGSYMKNLGLSSGSYVSGINNAGQIIGSSSGVFVYQNNSIEYIEVSGGARITSAMGINNNGYITGSISIATNNTHAYIYDGLSIYDIGTLGGGWTTGHSINDSGQVTGISYNSSNIERAFLYDGTEMIDIGTLGGNMSQGLDINNKGQIVGVSRTSLGVMHAFLYSNGLMKDISMTEGYMSSATALNNWGWAVGNYIASEIADDTTAFLYTNGQIFNLNLLLSPAYSGRYYITQAYDINDSGWIACSGYVNGVPQSFIAVPVQSTATPEPATITAMALGIAGIFCLRRKLQH